MIVTVVWLFALTCPKQQRNNGGRNVRVFYAITYPREEKRLERTGGETRRSPMKTRPHTKMIRLYILWTGLSRLYDIQYESVISRNSISRDWQSTDGRKIIPGQEEYCRYGTVFYETPFCEVSSLRERWEIFTHKQTTRDATWSKRDMPMHMMYEFKFGLVWRLRCVGDFWAFFFARVFCPFLRRGIRSTMLDDCVDHSSFALGTLRIFKNPNCILVTVIQLAWGLVWDHHNAPLKKTTWGYPGVNYDKAAAYLGGLDEWNQCTMSGAHGIVGWVPYIVEKSVG